MMFMAFIRGKPIYRPPCAKATKSIVAINFTNLENCETILAICAVMAYAMRWITIAPLGVEQINGLFGSLYVPSALLTAVGVLWGCRRRRGGGRL